MKLCAESIRYRLAILTETDRQFNMPISPSMVFVAEVRPPEGQFRRLNSTLNKPKSLNFDFARLAQQFPKGQENILNL
jgi:hypothetical protein